MSETDAPRASTFTHPALWIGLFFAVLVVMNAAFYVIAFQQESDLIPVDERAPAHAEVHGEGR